eukprot:3221838-Rhodomonas_salina.1
MLYQLASRLWAGGGAHSKTAPSHPAGIVLSPARFCTESRRVVLSPVAFVLSICACYALSGTELWCAVLSAYAPATSCPELPGTDLWYGPTQSQRKIGTGPTASQRSSTDLAYGAIGTRWRGG